MGTSKENSPKTKKKVDLTSFFSRKNEENGVWFRPETTPYCPFQLLVVGPTSSVAWVVNDQYTKDLHEAQAIEDLQKKAERIIEITAKKYAGLCIDIKVDDDVDLSIGGKAVTKENIYDIMYNSPDIQDEVYRFYNGNESFLGKKKSD